MAGSDKPFRGTFYGWTNILLLLCIQFAASGFVYYAYAVIFPEMIAAFDWNRGTASIGQSIALLGFGLFYPITAWMIGKYGSRTTLTTGLSIMLIGLLAIVTLVTEMWHWIAIWGVVVGLSFALTGPIASQTVVINWFNAKRATMIGVVITGSAIGGAVAQPALTLIMDQWGDWRSAWIASAIVVAISIVAVRFVIDHPEQVGQSVDGGSTGGSIGPDTSEPKRTVRTYRTSGDWTLRQVVARPTFYLLLCVGGGYMFTLTFLLAHGKLHLQDTGFSDVDAASILGLIILGSGIGRIPLGWLADRFEPRWLVTALLAFMIAGTAAIWSIKAAGVLYLAAFVFGFCFGGMLVALPMIMSNYFGEKVFAAVNATVAPILLPIAATAPAGAGYIYEATGSYDWMFVISLIVLGLAFFCAIALAPPKSPEEIVSA
jgi:MFS family permease